MTDRKSSFTIGDVVKLASGGLDMTIVEMKDETAICAWMGAAGMVERCNFPMRALVLRFQASSASQAEFHVKATRDWDNLGKED